MKKAAPRTRPSAELIALAGTSGVTDKNVYFVYNSIIDFWRMSDSLPDLDFITSISECFTHLGEINDFEGIVWLYDRMRAEIPLDDLPGSGPVYDLHFKAANAKLRCGQAKECEAILRAVIARQGQLISPRRLLASCVRHRDPEEALSILATVRSLPAFGADRLAVLTYIDLLWQTGGSHRAKAECETFSPERIGPDFWLALCNMETNSAKKLWFLNRFFQTQIPSAPAFLCEENFSLDTLFWQTGKPINDGPLVSIVMTTFNSGTRLDSAIRSLRAQSYANWELVVIDDGSRDDTPQRLTDWAMRDKRIDVILNEENRGTYVSRNQGLQRSRGEFVTFHDSDDLSHPAKIALHVESLARAPDCLANLSRWVRIDGTGTFLLKPWGQYSHENPSSLCFRREYTLANLGYFEAVRVGGDTEYRQRLCARYGDETVERLSPVLALGRHHAESLTQSGAGAVDSYGTSPARRAYTSAWLDRHVQQRASGWPLNAPPSTTDQPPSSVDVPAPELIEGSFERFGRIVTIKESKAQGFNQPTITHAADLRSNSSLSFALLLNADSEWTQGIRTIVWNVADIKQRDFSWQARRLRSLPESTLRRAYPAGTEVLIVYGKAAMSQVIGTVSRPPAQVVILAENNNDVAEIERILTRAGWRGALRLVALDIHGEGFSPANTELWPAAVRFGSFASAPSALDTLGFAFFGRGVAERDIAIMQRLTEATGLPGLALVEANDEARVAMAGITCQVVNRGRSFWADFFEKISFLVETEFHPKSVTLTGALGQALLRSRLAAVLSSDCADIVGAPAFAEEQSLTNYLRNLARNPSTFRYQQQLATMIAQERIGDEFHRKRLSSLVPQGLERFLRASVKDL